MSTVVTTYDVMDAVEFIAARLGKRHAYRIGERVHVPIQAGWSVAISTEDADNLCVEGCLRGLRRCRVVVDVRDRARLAEVTDEIEEMSGAVSLTE